MWPQRPTVLELKVTNPSIGTTQACLFRDEFEKLTTTGYAIYGLSTDSPKSNTTFRTKHNLPYTLLCDPAANLISAIGMKKAPSGTIRGVFVVNKDGKVEAISPGVSLALRVLVSSCSIFILVRVLLLPLMSYENLSERRKSVRMKGGWWGAERWRRMLKRENQVRRRSSKPMRRMGTKPKLRSPQKLPILRKS